MTSFAGFEVAVRTIYGEARGEPREGKHAVMWVILNRARGKGYGGPTLIGVCQRKFQFSCWNPGDSMRVKVELADVERLANCLEAATEVLVGKVPDPTGGATHYLNPEVTRRIRVDSDLPNWARDEWLTAKIGAHWFYKVEER